MAQNIDIPAFPNWAFTKEDLGADADFYALPRLVTHIDDAAIAALTSFYRDLLPPGGVLLDLMSSWVSHLPEDRAYGEVVGHGMNGEELVANPRLSRWFVQDFNQDPILPVADASIDAAMMCVATANWTLFTDIGRLLQYVMLRVTFGCRLSCKRLIGVPCEDR